MFSGKAITFRLPCWGDADAKSQSNNLQTEEGMIL
jgi:hypothetical protein